MPVHGKILEITFGGTRPECELSSLELNYLKIAGNLKIVKGESFSKNYGATSVGVTR